LESLLHRPGGECFALAINQRLDGSRNAVARPLGAAVWIAALPWLKRAPPAAFVQTVQRKVRKPVLLPVLPRQWRARTTPQLALRLRAKLPLERRAGARALLLLPLEALFRQAGPRVAPKLPQAVP
jgi:hypothetical protein